MTSFHLIPRGNETRKMEIFKCVKIQINNHSMLTAIYISYTINERANPTSMVELFNEFEFILAKNLAKANWINHVRIRINYWLVISSIKILQINPSLPEFGKSLRNIEYPKTKHHLLQCKFCSMVHHSVSVITNIIREQEKNCWNI